MRDPERINQILTSLKRVWERNPDLRLGQLIVISAKLKQQCPEVFSVEDDSLLQGLLDYEQLREATNQVVGEASNVNLRSKNFGR